MILRDVMIIICMTLFISLISFIIITHYIVVTIPYNNMVFICPNDNHIFSTSMMEEIPIIKDYELDGAVAHKIICPHCNKEMIWFGIFHSDGSWEPYLVNYEDALNDPYLLRKGDWS
jgi:hypothetical protein